MKKLKISLEIYTAYLSYSKIIVKDIFKIYFSAMPLTPANLKSCLFVNRKNIMHAEYHFFDNPEKGGGLSYSLVAFFTGSPGLRRV